MWPGPLASDGMQKAGMQNVSARRAHSIFILEVFLCVQL